MKQKKNSHKLPSRLWVYQAERVPLVAIVTFAALTTGVLHHLAPTATIRYLASLVIVVLYLIQIRVSDERKILNMTINSIQTVRYKGA